MDFNLKSELENLFEELDKPQDGGLTRDGDIDIPDFVSADSGEPIYFYRRARQQLGSVVGLAYESLGHRKCIAEKEFGLSVRRVVANIQASGRSASVDDRYDEFKRLLREEIERARGSFIHSFPAWTFVTLAENEWKMGPVCFMSWKRWLECVDFSDDVKDRAFGTPEANHRWKESILQALEEGSDEPLEGVARYLIRQVRGCPAVLRVEVRDLEFGRSRKLGEIACKAALDGVSLVAGRGSAFVQQALEVERLPPNFIGTLAEHAGCLLLPGSQHTDRVLLPSGAKVKQLLAKASGQLEAMGYAIRGLLDATHRHPNLSQRWVTALDWYAEAQRERSDAIALAKFVVALDVLAGGRESWGILRMVSNLLEVASDTPVRRGFRVTTLKNVVEGIYNQGRSRILHGTVKGMDRIESFTQDRDAADYLGRHALIEAAVRLFSYMGEDRQDGFLTIPPAGT